MKSKMLRIRFEELDFIKLKKYCELHNTTMSSEVVKYIKTLIN
jgi:hypothetical protein